jgi:ribosomal protein L11 methyltransferase
MPTLALTVDLPERDAELAASLLWDAGATGLEVRDSEAPPMPGVRGPAAGEAILVACFTTLSEAEAAQVALGTDFPFARSSVEPVPDEDWSVAWRSRIRATRVGRLWVGPPWESPPADAVWLHIEPKMAFGTGDHPTTALCLAAVDAYLASHPGASVLDVGTGTGVLALAARKLGAARVVGVDNDAVSVQLARENATANGVEGVELSASTLDQVQGRFDLVLANILANTLIELAPALAEHVGHRLILAGVLRHQAEDVARAFQAQGLERSGSAFDGDWVRLELSRGGAGGCG